MGMDDNRAIRERSERDASGWRYSNAFVNDGGPLIVLPKSLARHWHGSSFVWSEWLRKRLSWQIVDTLDEKLATFSQYYKDAGRAGSDFACIRFAGGHAIIVGSRPQFSFAQWLTRSLNNENYLIGAVMAQDGWEQLALELIPRLPESRWLDLGCRIFVSNEDYLLFHASTDGARLMELKSDEDATIGQAISWKLLPGIYELRLANLKVEQSAFYMDMKICQFRAV
jgi:hypothetical protein